MRRTYGQIEVGHSHGRGGTSTMVRDYPTRDRVFKGIG